MSDLQSWLVIPLIIIIWVVAVLIDVRGFVQFYIRHSDLPLKEAMRIFYRW